MMKSLLKTAAAPLAMVLATAPVQAAEARTLPVLMQASPALSGGAKDEAAIFDMFAKLFDTADKSPIAPEQMALGKVTAAALLPEGAYGKMMDQMLGTFLKPIMEMAPGLSASMVVTQTGMDYEAAEKLTEDQLKAIQAIIDPKRQEREGGMLGVMQPMMVEAGKILEPPMREGIARAYARKFSAAQLTEMNGFFATPTGKAYASESFAIQYDPEVMSATMKALPVLMSKFMGSAGELDAKMKALPQERKLTELSAAELDALSKLVGRTPAELAAHAKDLAELETAKAAAEAAGDAADAFDATADAADAAMSTETGSEPWFDRTNWSPEDNAKVEAIEEESAAIMEKQFAAEEQAIARAKARLEKKK